jgi:hypothetical protein
MKKNLVALMLGFVSIISVGCTSTAQKVTEMVVYSETGGFIDLAMNIRKELGEHVDVKMKISKWNNTPIDVLTKAQRYEASVLRSIKSVNEWYEITIEFDSTQMEYHKTQVARYQKHGMKDMVKKHSEHLTYYNDEYTKNLKTHKKYIAAIDSVKNLITTAPDKDEDWCYVYEFIVQISYKHPVTNKIIKLDRKCYSYIYAETMELAKIEENGKRYVRNLEKLL